jgi:hypothetical protein
VAGLEGLGVDRVDDGDPEMGDVVMFARLESGSYDVIAFLGHTNPVTRGALAAVAERAILFPLVDRDGALDRTYDGYLFRLPRALGFRDDGERALVLRAIPKAVEVPSEVVGEGLDRDAALRQLLRHATTGRWSWSTQTSRPPAQ